MNETLAKFVADSRQHGKDDTAIRVDLMGAGWSAADVNAALLPASAVPSPSSPGPAVPRPDFGMWVVFEYVLMFIALASTATGLAGLLHHMVDNTLAPDKGESLLGSYSSYSSYLTTFYIASLIISFPIFGWLALLLRRRLHNTPAIRGLRVRKIFIYIALTWTFVILMSRLIRTVYNFLDGGAEPLNSMLHLVVTLLVAGSIFLYFVLEIKQDGRAA